MKLSLMSRFLVVATLAALAPGLAPAAGATEPLSSRAAATISSFVGAAGSAKPAGSIDTQSRTAVQRAYGALRATLARSATTTADPSRCLAGTTSPASQAQVLQTINFFRGLTGVTAVKLDPALNAQAQQAAMLMSANGQLSHSPPRNWRCWNTTAAKAAGSSDLALGASGPQAIALYMSDPGQNNSAAGHRRWVLNPYVTEMGSGNTANSNALWVFGRTNPTASAPAFSSWPTAGYFPAGLEPGGRWSFSTSRSDVSLTSARASLAPVGGQPLPVRTLPIAPGYGLDTLVFQVGGLRQPTGAALAGYQVTITGMTQHGVALPPYSYVVRLTN